MNRKADLTCNSPFATVSVVVDSHNDKLNISSSAPTPTPIIRGTAPMNHPKAPRMTKPKKSPPAAKNRLKVGIGPEDRLRGGHPPCFALAPCRIESRLAERVPCESSSPPVA